MDRISGANYATVGGLRMWQDRNQQAGIFGTFGNALWFNGVQESILAVVTAAGLVPTDADNTQLLHAINSLAAALVAPATAAAAAASTAANAAASTANFASGSIQNAIQEAGYVFNAGVNNQLAGVVSLLGARQILSYTATTSFVVPQDWNTVQAIVIGAGAGGSAGGAGAGPGGASGGLAWGVVGLTPGSTASVVVGLGGAGGVEGGAAAQAGGSSGFGGLSATGGNAAGSGNAGLSINGGYGGQGSGGALNINGSPGGIGYVLDSGDFLGGHGAPAPFCGGLAPGPAGNSSQGYQGLGGQAPGAGGAGGTLLQNGGPGANGLVLIWR